ncbi:hypothetical protein PR048_005253, partial [Dryococelus australis]
MGDKSSPLPDVMVSRDGDVERRLVSYPVRISEDCDDDVKNKTHVPGNNIGGDSAEKTASASSSVNVTEYSNHRIFLSSNRGILSSVVKLNKSLYDLKQAPHAWSKRLVDFLKAHGLHKVITNKSVFVNDKGNSILAIWVDDGLVISNENDKIDQFMMKLQTEFEVKITDNPEHFEGLKIENASGFINIHQESYVNHDINLYMGSPVAWSTRKQPIILLNTAESEFFAASECVKEVLFLKSQLLIVVHTVLIEVRSVLTLVPALLTVVSAVLNAVPAVFTVRSAVLTELETLRSRLQAHSSQLQDQVALLREDVTTSIQHAASELSFVFREVTGTQDVLEKVKENCGIQFNVVEQRVRKLEAQPAPAADLNTLNNA